MCNIDENMVEEQVKEAVCRMKKLHLLNRVIKDFESKRLLYRSEHAILFSLDEEELAMVREWEDRTGNVVYHVIKTYMEFGLCYSYLYVSKSKDEWAFDNEALKEGYPIVYVRNMDDEQCSEYGSIGIHTLFGGVVRTK